MSQQLKRNFWFWEGQKQPSQRQKKNDFAEILLREQATLLAEGTRGALTASVEVKTFQGGRAWRFFIIASSISYRYELFRVEQAFSTPYPLRVFDFNAADPVKVADSEEAFVDHIREILGSEATEAVVASLLHEIQQRKQEDADQG
jgi:hypothetical protein